jgi:putative hydrolase of the HAD superfamily
MTRSVRALTWDFGGVLFRTEDQAPRQNWERKLKLQTGELHDLVFYGQTSRLATLGKASTEDIWHAISEQLDLNFEELNALRRDFWAGDRLDHELVETTRTLRKHLKTALLSNAWPDLRAYLVEDLQIDDAFDLLIISAEEGTAKPGEQIYQILLDRLNIRAEECVFIDDSLENVRAANDLGIQTVLFQDRAQTLDDLRSLLPVELSRLITN